MSEKCAGSCSRHRALNRAIVVVEKVAHTLTAADAAAEQRAFGGVDEVVADALMISFAMGVHHVLRQLPNLRPNRRATPRRVYLHGIATWWSTERTCTRAQESENSTVAVHELVVESAVRSRNVERRSIATDRSGVQPRA